jgi:hypothetical protein
MLRVLARTFARTGCTCVCFRHRGGFPVVWSFILVVSATMHTLHSLDRAIVVTGIFRFLDGLLWRAGKGRAATLDDMLNDVATARLQWVHQNQGMIVGPHNQLVFGGFLSVRRSHSATVLCNTSTPLCYTSSSNIF